MSRATRGRHNVRPRPKFFCASCGFDCYSEIIAEQHAWATRHLLVFGFHSLAAKVSTEPAAADNFIETSKP